MMKRYLFRTLSIFFVAIAVALIALLWIDSRQRYVSYYWTSASDARDICVGREPGRLVFSFQDKPTGFPFVQVPGWPSREPSGFEFAGVKKAFSDPYQAQDVKQSLTLAGFRYYQLELPSTAVFGGITPPVFDRVYVVHLPPWFAITLLLVSATILWRSSRRRMVNACRNCEYNLTGNTSGICPECGTAIESLR